jgi:5-formyltetrahydrofolate cyclo-ligase
LPRIFSYRERLMRLCPDDGATTTANRYGIPEPAATSAIALPALSVIFVPVVGFDATGHRIGMGAGYYDRLLAALGSPTRRQPLVVGLAYESSRVAALAMQAHDVPLDVVVTERGAQQFNDRA